MTACGPSLSIDCRQGFSNLSGSRARPVGGFSRLSESCQVPVSRDSRCRKTDADFSGIFHLNVSARLCILGGSFGESLRLYWGGRAVTQIMTCPYCGREMTVAPDLQGRNVQCPHCDREIHIPMPVADTVESGRRPSWDVTARPIAGCSPSLSRSCRRRAYRGTSSHARLR